MVNRDDMLDWYGTRLGMGAFLGAVRRMVTEKQYGLMLRWACRREPHLTEAEREEVENLVDRFMVLLERWEQVEANAAERYAAGRGEAK